MSVRNVWIFDVNLYKKGKHIGACAPFGTKWSSMFIFSGFDGFDKPNQARGYILVFSPKLVCATIRQTKPKPRYDRGSSGFPQIDLSSKQNILPDQTEAFSLERTYTRGALEVTTPVLNMVLKALARTRRSQTFDFQVYFSVLNAFWRGCCRSQSQTDNRSSKNLHRQNSS